MYLLTKKKKVKKKNMCIFMDCHGRQIFIKLNENKYIRKLYNLYHVTIVNYTGKNQPFYNNKSLNNNDVRKIKLADVLIVQYIENDRGFLNHTEIIKFCKKTCKIIKIPHYRSSIYLYKTLYHFNNKYPMINNWDLPSKITNIKNIEQTKKIIQREIIKNNKFNYDVKDMKKKISDDISNFNLIDSYSDIKMFDFFLKQYRNYRLFKGRRYPTSIFFFELSNRICSHLNIKKNNNYIDSYFAENTDEPIPEYWYNFCNFKFKNTHYIYGHIPILEWEWYYILLLTKDVNINNNIKNLKLIKFIRNKY